ncbi:MAG: non-heme iron oxygenase ferredoxin subunit [Betaproteobacteria bacterium]
MSGNWIDVAARDSIPEGDVVAIRVGGREVAVYGVDGEVFATDNVCTHGAGRMSDGFLEGREIECPLHQGRFDVCTGKALCAPLTADIRTYRVRVENLRVLVLFDTT